MAEINNIGTYATIMVLAVITIALGSSVLSNIRDSETASTTIYVDNTSLTLVNATNVSVGAKNVASASFSVRNASDFTIIGANNYTLYATDGIIRVNNSAYTNLAALATYNYTGDLQTGAYNASSYGMQTFTTIASNMSTLGLIVIIVIIIGLLAYFGNRR